MAGILSQRPASAAERSPFQPGSGKLPPYLAGRKPQQATIRECLNVLADRDSPASDIILYGPRGNGKTALIEWARREASTLKVPVTDVPGGDIQSVEQLAAALSVERRWLGALRGSSLGPVGVRLGSLPPGPVSRALGRRVRKGPFLILVDEAHVLGIEAGRSLLNTVQAFRRVDLPVLLIVAGTPDLPTRLGAMGASFWDRSEQLPLGRLPLADAADAVRIPLEERGRSIEDDALRQVVHESHGYPFFLQLWGSALWTGHPDPAAPISPADVDRARPKFERRRELFYDRRLDELERDGLVAISAKVAAEFSDGEQVLRQRVMTAIRAALEQEENDKAPDPTAVQKAARVLRHLGYIWPVVHRGLPCYEPGIPSLMQFVSNYAEARQSQLDTQ